MFAAPNNFVSLTCSSMLLPVDVLAPPFEYFTASSTHEHELYYRCLLVSGSSSAEVETRVEGAHLGLLIFRRNGVVHVGLGACPMPCMGPCSPDVCIIEWSVTAMSTAAAVHRRSDLCVAYPKGLSASPLRCLLQASPLAGWSGPFHLGVGDHTRSSPTRPYGDVPW